MTAKQKQNRERFKKVIAEAKKLRKKNPKLTQPQAVKQAWAIMYGETATIKKVGAVKKKPLTKVKATKSKKTGVMHTDTKSHNVNIRVVSGVPKISDEIIHTIKLYDAKRQIHQKGFEHWKNLASKNPKEKKQFLKHATENKNLVTYYTKQIASLRLKLK